MQRTNASILKMPKVKRNLYFFDESIIQMMRNKFAFHEQKTHANIDAHLN